MGRRQQRRVDQGSRTNQRMTSPGNELLADKLREMADVLEVQHEVGYRIAAYRRAAKTLLKLEKPIDAIVRDEALKGVVELPGIGRGIGTAIVEIVTTGRWIQLDRLSGALEPEHFPDCSGHWVRIHNELNADALEQLEQAAHDGRLERVPGVGARRALAITGALTDRFIITHGNGPQVGLLALQSAVGPAGSQQPLDVLSAETEGMLGYLIEQELRNVLPSGREVASILSQLVVDPKDPAFSTPTKPIGPVYSEDEAQRLASERGWSIVRNGTTWRRAVASPRPLAILGLGVIALLASRGVVVICVGGGGIPVSRVEDGRLYGVEAVIDKDHASALLAREVKADCLLLLTDVDSVYSGWRTARARSIAAAGPNDLDPTQFEPGSMRPKVEAAIEFARRTGKRAAVGRLEDAAALLNGSVGTSFECARGPPDARPIVKQPDNPLQNLLARRCRGARWSCVAGWIRTRIGIAAVEEVKCTSTF